jgi:TrmH family RNA methyltransferase
MLAGKLILIENDKLTLTIKGEETLSQLWTIIENTEKQILSCFSTEEKNQLFSYLKRVSNNCISIINEVTLKR